MSALRGIFRYPIKGFSGEKLTHAEVRSDFGIAGDRKYGLAHNNQFPSPPPAQLPWHAKKNFVQQNDWPDAYFLKMQWNGPDNIKIEDGKNTANFQLTRDADTFAKHIESLFSQWKPHKSAYQPAKSNLTLVGLDDSRFPDRFKNHISILNQASLDELNKLLPTATNMDVFRGNLIVDAFDAWEEFKWDGKKIRVGSVEFIVDKPIVRCFNTEINPSDAQNPLPVLKTLAKLHRKAIFGVMANVVKGGTIHEGDRVEILDP